MIARLRGLPARPGARAAAGLAAAGVLLLLSRAPGDLAPAAARGGLAACAVGALAVLARRRGAAARPASALVVVARAPLSRDAGLALVEVDGRRLLVGFGADRVALLDGAPAPAAPGGRP